MSTLIVCRNGKHGFSTIWLCTPMSRAELLGEWWENSIEINICNKIASNCSERFTSRFLRNALAAWNWNWRKVKSEQGAERHIRARTYAAYGPWHVITIMLHLFMKRRRKIGRLMSRQLRHDYLCRTNDWVWIGAPAAQDNHLVKASPNYSDDCAWAKALLIMTRIFFSPALCINRNN